MGYFVSLSTCDFTVPADRMGEAFEAVKALNQDNSLKYRRSGAAGVTTVGPHPDAWFAWMPWNYDETCESLGEVLGLLGFKFDVNEYGLTIHGYEAKTGSEDKFIAALAPFVKDGSYMVWRGEDDSQWRWLVRDGKIVEQTAQVSWV